MKKTSSFTFLVFFIIVLSLYSCKKDEVAPLTTYNVPKAIIKGKAFAQLDIRTSSPGYEFAPAGTKIILQVALSEYGIDAGKSLNSYKSYEATVNSTGDYIFTIDATTKGISVYLFCNDFDYLQKQGSIDVRYIYHFASKQLSVIAGQTTFTDIIYSNF